jgi:hypothetical protein
MEEKPGLGERLRIMWGLLNTPSDFRDKPYEGMLNQFGHFAGGAGAFILICCMIFAVQGEMPSRPVIAWSMIVLYVVVVESRIQGWRGMDSIEDSMFVSMGILTVSTSVYEIGHEAWVSTISLHVGNLMLSLVSAGVACLTYGLARIRSRE